MVGILDFGHFREFQGFYYLGSSMKKMSSQESPNVATRNPQKIASEDPTHL